jgi:ribosomal protein S18 acetylase RimI-like enzyme
MCDGDVSAVVVLVNGAFRGAYQFVSYDEETFRARVQDRKWKVLVAEEGGEVVGSTAYDDGYWGEEIRWLFVGDVQGRRIVESRLVGEIEKCVRRGAVFTSVDAGSPRVREWEGRGYELDDGLYHMVARLDRERSLPVIPEDVLLRSLGVDEEKEFVEAVNAGFGWERVKVADLERWKTENSPFDEGWVQLAELAKRIVSVVVSKPDTYFNRFFNGRRGYLGPAATLSEFRNRNLASALTVRAMNYLLVEGSMDSVALHTGDRNLPSVTLLQKLGFEIKHHWKFMRKNFC